MNYTKCSIHNFFKNHLPSYSIYLYIVLNDGITTQSIVFKVKFLVQEESFEKKKLLDFSSIMQQKKLIAEQCSKKRPLGTLPFFFMPYESNIEETASTFSSCEKKKRTLFEATTGNPRNTLLGCLKFLRYAFFVNLQFPPISLLEDFFLYIQVPLY